MIFSGSTPPLGRHVDRDRQFQDYPRRFHEFPNPIISMDTKHKKFWVF